MHRLQGVGISGFVPRFRRSVIDALVADQGLQEFDSLSGQRIGHRMSMADSTYVEPGVEFNRDSNYITTRITADGRLRPDA